MTDPAPCLHCAILDLVHDFAVAHHLSVNETTFKLVEALASEVSGIEGRKARRQFMVAIQDQLRDQVRRAVQERQRQGIKPHEQVRMN